MTTVATEAAATYAEQKAQVSSATATPTARRGTRRR